ncbi:hypothetical protein M8J76_011378 [Diaphorina citri]|nr:hypothetical protein M8J76_011378 [Diaphorina citri]
MQGFGALGVRLIPLVLQGSHRLLHGRQRAFHRQLFASLQHADYVGPLLVQLGHGVFLGFEQGFQIL